jgi:UPF0755 protein
MSEQADRDKARGGWLGARRAGPKSPSEALKPAAAPPPPLRVTKRRRRPFIALMSGLFTTALVLAGVIGIGVMVLGEQARAPGPLPTDKVVIIPKESGLGEITALLEREGVINHPWAFRISALTSGLWTRLKAGEYLFKANVSVREVLEVIEQGKAVLHSITIPEGLTSEQIVARLMENDILTGEVTQLPREGTLLPDTHKFQRGTTRQDLINRMAQEQRRVLNEIWARRSADIPIRTPQELVILASIVEKETGRADERPRVAGVFINRINRKMKLQSDPTIVYGIVGGKGTLGRGITRAEINQATPYNTYVIDGLPPGPIANPGRAAMQAVANPSRTKELYFVADGTGGHAFAETLEQHNRNVARWRQIEAARREPGKPSPEANIDRVEPPAADTRTQGPGQPAGIAPAGTAIGFTGDGEGQQTELETFPGPAAVRRPVTGSAAGGANGARARAFDASEGTARDPLRNRNFDLTTPKTVPPVR